MLPSLAWLDHDSYKSVYKPLHPRNKIKCRNIHYFVFSVIIHDILNRVTFSFNQFLELKIFENEVTI